MKKQLKGTALFIDPSGLITEIKRGTVIKPKFVSGELCIKVGGKYEPLALLLAETFLRADRTKHDVFMKDGNCFNLNISNLLVTEKLPPNIHFYKRGHKHFRVVYKQKSIGYYSTLEEAKKALQSINKQYLS